jgi:hypothetical protein
MGRDMENISEPNISKARRQQLLDEILQDAADIVLYKIRKLKDSNDEHHMNVPVAKLPWLVNLQEVARVFKERLEYLHSNEKALAQRLHKWKRRGIDHDPVAARGRPRSLVTSTLLANHQAQGHIGPKAAIPVACGKTHNDGVSKKRQKNVFQRMSEESGLIQGSRKLRQSLGNCGRPVNSEFERVVIERIERQVLYQGLSLSKLSFSLQAIVDAGKQTAQEAPFCNSYIVQRLKFSMCWAAALRRRQAANDSKQHRTMPLRL